MDLQGVPGRFEPPGGARARVAVDAMGGDHAPEEIVRGAVGWAREHPETDVILVGDEPRLRPFFDGPLPTHVSLVQAADSVAMDEHAAAAVRRKRDASINVCMRLVRDGLADAVVTAGHTGAGVAAAIIGLGRLRGVDRPALAVQLQTPQGPFILLDIGATTDSTGHNLAQYARMGAIFAERVVGVPDPRVALLSIGEEAGKGEARVQEATRLLAASDLRFVGNVEGKDLPAHLSDIVVCDATVGNVTMKFFEGLAGFIFDQLRQEFKRLPWGPLGYLFMRPGIARIRRTFDYERFGAAPLLGVKGTVLITHGRARRRMIGFAVEVGAAAARAHIPEHIAAALAEDAAREAAAEAAS
ncbi:MAG TPA: phosphate acyltransferase PlsX [Candidatus Limnocylindrales bacterium]|nr:phosphate acyltransferase PlsX [Candidatus Limnocylindrales bacterium]